MRYNRPTVDREPSAARAGAPSKACRSRAGLACRSLARSLQAGILLFTISGCSGRVAVPPGETYNLGIIFADSQPVIDHTFVLTNPFDRPVRIVGESHSCGCTTVDVPRAEIKPGQSVPLKLTLNTPRGFGGREVRCAVKTDHPEYPEWGYILVFETYLNARIVPEDIRLPDQMPDQEDAGEPGSARDDDPEADRSRKATAAWLELYQPDTRVDPWHPQVISGDEQVDVQLDPQGVMDQVPGGILRTRYRLALKLKEQAAKLPTGLYSQEVVIKANADLRARALAMWHVIGSFSVTPSQIHFGMISDPDRPVARRVVIRRRGDRSFRITNLVSDSTDVTGQLVSSGEGPDESDRSRCIELTLRRPPAGGHNINSPAVAGSIQVTTDQGHDFTIPWSAFYRREDPPG